jgi:hypothetical protein
LIGDAHVRSDKPAEDLVSILSLPHPEATMPNTVAAIADRLAENAEAVCRHYLSNGRRQGRYWLAGDVHNTPGRSLYVRLTASESGHRAGSWRDSATLEHGDLLDLIAAVRGLDGLRATLDEAQRFLGLPASALPPSGNAVRATRPAAVEAGSAEAASRLFAFSRPIAGTLASRYLRERGIAMTPDLTALRFHPRCWYRQDTDSLAPADGPDAWPALIAAVTDLAGTLTGVHRTWLNPSGRAKAPLAEPRRSLGHLLGYAVRFGAAGDVMAAGEGIETVLSLRQVMPALPLAAALSAAHLAAVLFPPGLRRLYIVRDNDPAGRRAEAVLTERAQTEGIEMLILAPALGDFNDDLRQFGADALAAAVRTQIASEDVSRFCRPAPRDGRSR